MLHGVHERVKKIHAYTKSVIHLPLKNQMVHPFKHVIHHSLGGAQMVS